MCGCVHVWVCACVGVYMCGCVHVWVCACVGVCMCGCVHVPLTSTWRGRGQTPPGGYRRRQSWSCQGDTCEAAPAGPRPRATFDAPQMCLQGIDKGFWGGGELEVGGQRLGVD